MLEANDESLMAFLHQLVCQFVKVSIVFKQEARKHMSVCKKGFLMLGISSCGAVDGSRWGLVETALMVGLKVEVKAGGR